MVAITILILPGTSCEKRILVFIGDERGTGVGWMDEMGRKGGRNKFCGCGDWLDEGRKEGL